MKSINNIDKKLEKYYKQKNEIPQLDEEVKQVLRRMVERNSSKYDLEKDELFVSDCVFWICYKVKRFVKLSDKQKQLLTLQFVEIKNIKKARKKIDVISNKFIDIFCVKK